MYFTIWPYSNETYIAAADNVGGFVVLIFEFMMLHHPTGVSWVLLGLSRRQYKVYNKKISPEMSAADK